MQKLRNEELGRKSVEQFKLLKKIPLVVILENIRSAYNVGSVFRTCDAFAVEEIIICGYTAKPPHKEIKKTALGAEDSVSWRHFENAADAIEEIKKRDYKVYAIEQAADSLKLHEFELNREEKIAIVFGNEVEGVIQETINQCNGCIEIEQYGTKHSLNIAVCAGVVIFHLACLVTHGK